MRSGIKVRHELSTLKRMIIDNQGATAAIFAISMPMLVGMGALAVDVGLWSVQKRHAQGAADQAAYSAAVANSAGDDATLEARAITAGMGFVHGDDGTVITVNNPPTAGSFIGEDGYWEVIVERPQSMGLAALFLGSAPTARARAVAGTASGGAACIIGLSTTGVAVNIGNNSVSNSGCGVYSNSDMAMKNNSSIAGTAYVSGDIDKQNANQITIGNEVTGVAPIQDPYAQVPSPGTCSGNTKITDGGTYAGPHYCAGVDIKNNANANAKTINLQPGVYYIGTTFNLENNITVNGTGVTLVFMPGTTFSLKNNVIFNITAPTSGDYAGIAIMGRDMAGDTLAWNNGTFNIQGAIYFPNDNLSIKNNFNSNLCTQLVGLTVSINNNATMFDECPGSGILNPGGGKISLLE